MRAIDRRREHTLPIYAMPPEPRRLRLRRLIFRRYVFTPYLISRFFIADVIDAAATPRYVVVAAMPPYLPATLDFRHDAFRLR